MGFPTILLVLLSALAASGCSGNPPEILESKWTLVLYEDREKGSVYEYLSVGVLARDEDGLDDLESLSIVNDSAELYWLVPQDRWTKRQIRQETWLVADSLTTADLGPVPRGNYRLVLSDYSGARAETSISVNPPKSVREAFPSIRPGKNSIVLSSNKSEASLLVLSAAGVTLGSFTLRKGDNALAPILSNQQIKSQAKNLYLHEYGEGGAARVSGPYDALEILFPR